MCNAHMQQNIIIQPLGENTFEVTVSEGAEKGETTHTVSVSDAYLTHLGWQPEDAGTLIRESFEFLLAREPKESILKEFALRDIVHYFPEFEETVKG